MNTDCHSPGGLTKSPRTDAIRSSPFKFRSASPMTKVSGGTQQAQPKLASSFPELRARVSGRERSL